MSSDANIDTLRRWIGCTEKIEETIEPWPSAALLALLDHPAAPLAPGAAVPVGAHWLHFHRAVRQSELGPDGHPKRGGFLPPVDALPRRMWAGGWLEFARPLRVGDAATRRSTVADVQAKRGSTGPLVFVTVEHAIDGPAGVVISERQDIVYRGPPAAGEAARSPRPAPTDAQWRRTIRSDPVLLFRYSALTFNGHRIHYDRPYATETEGYPDLVVHGPLLATLLLDLCRREARRPVRTFEFRAVAPVFDTAPFTVAGNPDGDTVALWVAGPDGALAMTATAVLG